MAKIIGTTEGLVPQKITLTAAPRPPEPSVRPTIGSCKACGGWWKLERWEARREEHDLCKHCMSIYGGEDAPFARGATNVLPEDAQEKLDAVRKSEWVIVLRRLTLGHPAGVSVEVGPGDCLRPARIGADRAPGPCSQERSRACATLEVQIGPVTITLWPHEFSAVSWVSIMQMRAAGELEECYVSDGDEQGHFRPPEALREEIYAAFGALVNA